MSIVFMTDRQVLAGRHASKHARTAAARAALGTVFGKHRVTVHCGSQGRWEPGDSTHWLYIGISLRKGDMRAHWRHARCRREVIRILKKARVPLSATGYPASDNDPYAVSLDVYPFRPAMQAKKND
jgi:hypothetical protein